MSNEIPAGSESTLRGMDLLMAKVHAARLLATARHHFDEGWFAVVELLLRDYAQDGESAELHRAAINALSLAISKRPRATDRRYLVIREWMCGFWSDVDHVIGACVVAEATGRIPTVYWGKQSRYGSAKDDNAWTQFFEPVADASLDDVRDAAQSYYPSKWNKDNLESIITERSVGPEGCRCALDIMARSEDVVVSDFHCSIAEILPFLSDDNPFAGRSIAEARRLAVRRYLRPVAEIREYVDRFVAQHFGSGPMLGVHYRGLDKFHEEPELEDINSRYPAIIEQRLAADPLLRVFLLTDSNSFAHQCKEKYSDRVLTTSAQRADGDVGLHHLEMEMDPSQLGSEVLIDTLLAARCDQFIGLGSSNVSIFVRDLKNWPAGAFELMGRTQADCLNMHYKTRPHPPRPV